jgi:putative flippase GtrA
MENNFTPLTKKDYFFTVGAGLLIGLFILPVVRAAKPDFFFQYAWFIFFFFLIATPLGVKIAHRIGQKFSTVWQLAKFGVIGFMNSLADLGMLAIITFAFRNYFGINSADLITGGFILTFYSLFKAASFILANINSYYWNKYWTFENQTAGKSGAEFFQFFTVSLVGLAINVLAASLMVKFAPLGGLSSDQIGLLGGIVGSLSGLAWNFIGYKFIVFKKS